MYKEIKNKCVYCGNNPTNHFFCFLSQTVAVPFTPVFRFFAIIHNKYIDIIAGWVLAPYLWLFRKLGLWGINKDPERAFTERSKVIWLEAIARGIEMEEMTIFRKPIEQYRAKINGRWRYFESIPIPPQYKAISYSWMDDKWELKKFLRKHNIPVAYGASVSNEKDALNIFSKGKKPFITKPRLGSRGRHTNTFLVDEKSFLEGFRIAKQLGYFVIAEEQLFGSVYRGTYVGGEVVGILRGDPARITGDGINTIEKLIEIKNKNKNPKVKDVVITKMIKEFIGRQNLTITSILEKGKTIDLSEKIGLSYGGYAVEEITRTHPKIIEYVKRAGDALDAPVIGFDFIIPDITTDPDTQHWGIIEANSLPFINLHHFPMDSEPINVAGKVWDLWLENR
jgi:cyanophycin synthetase